MQKIRVLVVDDAAVVRRMVSAAIDRDPELITVGTARDGQDALDRLSEISPDVVLLDLEMPRMDGLETLAELRRTHPRLPVIMFSRFTSKGVEATIHALTLGADDYVPKPGDGLSVETCVGELLIPKIKALGQRRHSESAQTHTMIPSQPTTSRSGSRSLVEAVVIASSTGGPNALAEVLGSLPARFSTPVLIAQHMPPDFTARLAERLDTHSPLQVREATGGMIIEPGTCWVAPGNFHLIVRRLGPLRVSLALDQGPPVHSCRPAADVLFQSAVEAYGAGLLGVVLTGMGQDGKAGCERIRAAGGQVLAQDEATSVVWSMPGAVATAGLADEVLPLQRIGAAIARRCQGSFV